MCGITGAFKARTLKEKRPVTERAFALYQDQTSRGQRGFGAVIVHPNGHDVLRATTPEAMAVDIKLYPTLNQHENLGCLFHHRFPTSSANTLKQTHPIFVSHESLDFDYYVAHNGVISNEDSLREEHEKEGYVYTTSEGPSFNDSEAAAIEFCKAIEFGCELRSHGSQALVALSLDKKDGKAVAVYFGTNGSNPLTYSLDNGYLEIASENLKNKAEPDKLYRFDLTTGKRTASSLKFEAYVPAQIGFKYSPAYTREDTTDEDYPCEEYEDSRREIDAAVDDYIDLLADPETAANADVEETLKSIRASLEAMRTNDQNI